MQNVILYPEACGQRCKQFVTEQEKNTVATSPPLPFGVLISTDEIFHARNKPHRWLTVVLFTPFILSLVFVV